MENPEKIKNCTEITEKTLYRKFTNFIDFSKDGTFYFESVKLLENQNFDGIFVCFSSLSQCKGHLERFAIHWGK